MALWLDLKQPFKSVNTLTNRVASARPQNSKVIGGHDKFLDYSQLSNKVTGTMEKKPTKISCGTHFFLRYYWNEFKIFTCGTFISAVL